MALSEADDAVQEAWLRLSRSGAEGIENFDGDLALLKDQRAKEWNTA